MQETQEITRTNAQQAGQTVRPDQPYVYPPRYEFREPDWKRWPAYANVTQEEWESALWQRQHSIKNLRELAQVWGPYAFIFKTKSHQVFINISGKLCFQTFIIVNQCLNTAVISRYCRRISMKRYK